MGALQSLMQRRILDLHESPGVELLTSSHLLDQGVMPSPKSVRFSTIVIGVLAGGAAHGGPPSIASISPRGAQRGQAVTLIVEGSDLAAADAELLTSLSSGASVITSDEKLKPVPNRIAFRVDLNAFEAPALHVLRVLTREGISNPVIFRVGVLPEVNEEEPNDVPSAAKPIALPVTVNGRLGPTDRDTFRFSAKAGERLVFEVEARRLGSAVDPTLHVLRADGRELALGEDTYGLDVDARIDHTFKDAGEYLIQVHDAMYLGRAPDFYRLRIGAFAYAEAIFPLGGRAGSEIDVALDGGSLEAPVVSRVRLDPDPLERWTQVSLPPSLDAGGALPFRFRIGALPEALEGPREKPGAALPLPASTTMNGRLLTPREADRYALEVAPGQAWTASVEAASLGSWLDGVLTVSKEDGAKIAAADDDGGSPDPKVDFAVPEGVKKVVLSVEDLHHRGGKPFGYRLTARPQRPDFALKLNTTRVGLPLGGTALIEVECVRAGYGGPVSLSITPAPVGFSLRGGEILPDQAKGYVTLTGPDVAAFGRVLLEVTGTGGTAADPIVRRAQGTVFLASDQNVPVSPLTVAAIEGAVTSAPPLVVKAAGVIEVVVGHAAALPVEAVRAQGVSGEIKLVGLSGPPGVTAGEGKIAADKASGTIPLNAAPNAALREGDAVLQGIIKVKDADVAAPAPAFRVRFVRPFAAEVATASMQAAPGSTAAITGKIARKSPFGGKVQVKVEGLPAGMTAAPVEIAPETSDFKVDIVVSAAQAHGSVTLTVVLSTPLGDPNQPVVHALPGIPVALTVTPPTAAAAGGGEKQ